MLAKYETMTPTELRAEADRIEVSLKTTKHRKGQKGAKLDKIRDLRLKATYKELDAQAATPKAE